MKQLNKKNSLICEIEKTPTNLVPKVIGNSIFKLQLRKIKYKTKIFNSNKNLLDNFSEKQAKTLDINKLINYITEIVKSKNNNSIEIDNTTYNNNIVSNIFNLKDISNTIKHKSETDYNKNFVLINIFNTINYFNNELTDTCIKLDNDNEKDNDNSTLFNLIDAIISESNTDYLINLLEYVSNDKSSSNIIIIEFLLLFKNIFFIINSNNFKLYNFNQLNSANNYNTLNYYLNIYKEGYLDIILDYITIYMSNNKLNLNNKNVFSILMNTTEDKVNAYSLLYIKLMLDNINLLIEECDCVIVKDILDSKFITLINTYFLETQCIIEKMFSINNLKLNFENANIIEIIIQVEISIIRLFVNICNYIEKIQYKGNKCIKNIIINKFSYIEDNENALLSLCCKKEIINRYTNIITTFYKYNINKTNIIDLDNILLSLLFNYYNILIKFSDMCEDSIKIIISSSLIETTTDCILELVKSFEHKKTSLFHVKNAIKIVSNYTKLTSNIAYSNYSIFVIETNVLEFLNVLYKEIANVVENNYLNYLNIIHNNNVTIMHALVILSNLLSDQSFNNKIIYEINMHLTVFNLYKLFCNLFSKSINKDIELSIKEIYKQIYLIICNMCNITSYSQLYFLINSNIFYIIKFNIEKFYYEDYTIIGLSVEALNYLIDESLKYTIKELSYNEVNINLSKEELHNKALDILIKETDKHNYENILTKLINYKNTTIANKAAKIYNLLYTNSCNAHLDINMIDYKSNSSDDRTKNIFSEKINLSNSNQSKNTHENYIDFDTLDDTDILNNDNINYISNIIDNNQTK